MQLTRRSLRLTASDRSRLEQLRGRSGLGGSASECLLAALAYLLAALPIEPEAIEQLVGQLASDENAASPLAAITSLSLGDREDAELEQLAQATLCSATTTVRIALLLFSLADDSTLRLFLLSLPARAAPGPPRRTIRSQALNV